MITPPAPLRDRVGLARLQALSEAARGVRLGPEQWPGSVLRGRRGPRLPHPGYIVTGMRRLEAADCALVPCTHAALRGGHPLGPALAEDRDRPTLLILDRRAAMNGGSGRATRSVVATEAAALFAHAAHARDDRVGAVIFGEDELAALRPRRGAAATTRLLSRLCLLPSGTVPAAADRGRGPDLAMTLDSVARLAPSRHLLILLSGFHGFDASIAARLSRLARRNLMILCPIIDPAADMVYGDLSPRLVALARNAEAANVPLLPFDTTEPTAPQMWRLMGVPE